LPPAGTCTYNFATTQAKYFKIKLPDCRSLADKLCPVLPPLHLQAQMKVP